MRDNPILRMAENERDRMFKKNEDNKEELSDRIVSVTVTKVIRHKDGSVTYQEIKKEADHGEPTKDQDQD